MRTIWNDIRYGLRMLAASPGFTAVAILSLAVGIGANTSTFSLADALILHPLPVPKPSQIVRVLSTSPSNRFDMDVSYPDYLDFRDHSNAISGLLACEAVPMGFAKDSKSLSRPKLGLAVSPNYFDVLGIQPSLGRPFRADEERRPVVVLSDALWQAEFNRDPSVIGRTVSLSKTGFTVIGIAPKSFPGLNLLVHEDFYFPAGNLSLFGARLTADLEQRSQLSFNVFGRLAPGHTAEQAQAQLQAVAHGLEREHPGTNRGRGVLAMPELKARFALNSDKLLDSAVLLAIAIAVLLIACANVANMLLARGRARAREIAIRLAIGASRKRLFQQLITESLLLAVIGGAFGLLLVLFSIDFFSSLRLPTTLPIWLTARPDLRVVLFAFATTLASGVIFGVAPALHALRSDVNTTLKSGDMAPSRKRLRFQGRNALVIGQIGVSMLLLVSSGLLIRDFSVLTAARLGFRVDHVLMLGLDPQMAGYNEVPGAAFYRQLLERVQSLPGVRSVALAQHVPLGFSSSVRNVEVEGFELKPTQHSIAVSSNIVSDQYFSLMHIPIVKGRAFDDADLASSPHVAIINQAMAEKYWPNRNAIGGRFRMEGKETLQVVGIAKTIKYRDPGEQPLPFLYLPLSQQYSSFISLYVETAGDPASMTNSVLAQIRALDAGMPVADVQTLQHFFEQGALFGTRLIMQVVTAIGSLGLLLAVTGLYSVIAYSVSRRTREIGIRMAIGADSGNVARLVLRQGLTLTAIGAAIGLALALVASKLLASLLAGISPRDPLIYVLAPALLAAISLLACYIPARRAARVDPLVALRHE